MLIQRPPLQIKEPSLPLQQKHSRSGARGEREQRYEQQLTETIAVPIKADQEV